MKKSILKTVPHLKFTLVKDEFKLYSQDVVFTHSTVKYFLKVKPAVNLNTCINFTFDWLDMQGI